MLRSLMLLLTLLPSLTLALSFGDVKITSHLGEPLDAEIKIFDAERYRPEQIKVSLASEQAFKRVGLLRSPELSQLEFLVSRKLAQTVLSITSQEDIQQPSLEFLVEISSPDGKVERGYTLLLDPPEMPSSLMQSSNSGQGQQDPGREQQEKLALAQEQGQKQGLQHEKQKLEYQIKNEPLNLSNKPFMIGFALCVVLSAVVISSRIFIRRRKKIQRDIAINESSSEIFSETFSETLADSDLASKALVDAKLTSKALVDSESASKGLVSEVLTENLSEDLSGNFPEAFSGSSPAIFSKNDPKMVSNVSNASNVSSVPNVSNFLSNSSVSSDPSIPSVQTDSNIPSLSSDSHSFSNAIFSPEELQLSNLIHSEITMKLDLARNYFEIEDNQSAINLLKDVMTRGNEGQKQTAERLLTEIQAATQTTPA